MGWSSSADPMSGMRLNFDSKEEAIAYASKNGWKYEERAPHAKANENEEAGAKIYAHNFLAKRTEAELADAKAKGVRSKEYDHAGAGIERFSGTRRAHAQAGCGPSAPCPAPPWTGT